MPKARNDDELVAMFRKPMRDVVDYVVQKLWNENREVVRHVVYDVYMPTVYNRTGEFATAWDYSVKELRSGDHVAQGSFSYAPDLMSTGSDNHESDDYGQHVSIVDGSDVRSYLANIIYQGAYGSAWRSGVGARDAWSELLRIVGRRGMNRYFQEAFKKMHLEVLSTRISLNITYEN